MTMEMPEVMSKVIHDFIRPTEWCETKEETYEYDADDGTKTTAKRFKDEDEANSHYDDLIEKIEDDQEVIKITFKQYKFINGKKEIITEDYLYEEECSCCSVRTLIAYDISSHYGSVDGLAETCGVCREYICDDCCDYHLDTEQFICEGCQ